MSRLDACPTCGHWTLWLPDCPACRGRATPYVPGGYTANRRAVGLRLSEWRRKHQEREMEAMRAHARDVAGRLLEKANQIIGRTP